MIIYINGNKYNITEFIDEHPGGANVFKNEKDMTKEFNEVNHSDAAIKMLEKYRVNDHDKKYTNDSYKKNNLKNLANNEITENEIKITENEIKITENEIKITENEIKITENEIKKISFHDFFITKFNQLSISRLFTHEDKTHIHKILGTITLLNASYFIYDLAYPGCKGEITLRKKDWSFMLLFWLQILLGITGLQFKLPTKYNKIKPFMSQEYRLLVITYTLRSILIATILFFLGKNLSSHICIIGITFLATYMADIIAKYYKDKQDTLGAKISSYPFWSSCDTTTRNIIKNFYSFEIGRAHV